MTGRITTDLSVVTEEDRSYCKFCIAVDQPKQKGVDTVETDTFTCLAFDDNAKSVNFQNRFARVELCQIRSFTSLDEIVLHSFDFGYHIL